MASSSDFILYVLISFVIQVCNGLINQENCPSQVQSTLKMAESLDQLSKVLNQTIKENLKIAPEKLIEGSSSRSGKSTQCQKFLNRLLRNETNLCFTNFILCS